jgi:hypothetical protein
VEEEAVYLMEERKQRERKRIGAGDRYNLQKHVPSDLFPY